MIADKEYLSEYNRILDEIEDRDTEAKNKAIADANEVKKDASRYVSRICGPGLPGIRRFIEPLRESSKNRELAAAGDNEEKKAKIMEKYAKRQKRISVLQAGINVLEGITKAIAQGGILGLVTGAIVAASGYAQVQAIKATPLAKGGIAYSPVNALVGEYQGARNNPEVIAPLNKLKDLLGISSQGGGMLNSGSRGLI